MADFFKCRVGDKTYELPKLTLGEARILKHDFDLHDLEEFSPSDPDTLVGLLYLCLKREQPTADKATLIAQVEALDVDDFEVDPATEPDPTPVVPAAEPAPEASESATIPAEPGIQHSPTS